MTGKQSKTSPVRALYAQRRLKAIAARWDARAKSWDSALLGPDCCFNEDDAYQRFIRTVRRLIARQRAFCARHGVIDVGCGTGLILAEVASAFAWGVGIDISPQMISQARAKRIAKTKFVLGDCFAMPALCPKAGMVFSRGVLLSHYGLRQGETLLRAAQMVLVPGGFLVFDFLNETACNRAGQAPGPENKICFTREEISSLAERAGFSASRISGRPERRARLLIART